MELTGDPPSPDLIYPYTTSTTTTNSNKNTTNNTSTNSANNSIRKHTSYDDIHTGISKIITTKHIQIVCSPVYCIKIRKSASVTRYVYKSSYMLYSLIFICAYRWRSYTTCNVYTLVFMSINYTYTYLYMYIFIFYLSVYLLYTNTFFMYCTYL